VIQDTPRELSQENGFDFSASLHLSVKFFDCGFLGALGVSLQSAYFWWWLSLCLRFPQPNKKSPAVASRAKKHFKNLSET